MDWDAFPPRGDRTVSDPVAGLADAVDRAVKRAGKTCNELQSRGWNSPAVMLNDHSDEMDSSRAYSEGRTLEVVCQGDPVRRPVRETVRSVPRLPVLKACARL